MASSSSIGHLRHSSNANGDVMTTKSTIASSLARINVVAYMYKCDHDDDRPGFVMDLMVDLIRWCAASHVKLDPTAEFAIATFLYERTKEEPVFTGQGSGDGPSDEVRRRRKKH